MAATTLARVSLPAVLRRALSTRPCHSAAAARVPRRLDDAAAIAKKMPLSLVSVRCTANGSDRALQPEVDTAVPRSVPVHTAYELQQAGHRYLDVRTESEFSAGHPERALNIPYMFRTGSSGMAKNTQFLEQVSRIFGKDDQIIVGCQSGRRSLMAAAELYSAGFTAVTDIAGGFSSWRENGLPVNQ